MTVITHISIDSQQELDDIIAAAELLGYKEIYNQGFKFPLINGVCLYNYGKEYQLVCDSKSNIESWNTSYNGFLNEYFYERKTS